MLINIVKFVLLAYLVAFCQTILANVTEIAAISPNFGTIIIVLLVLKSGYRTAFTAAFVVAFVIDVLNPELAGLGLAIRFSIAVAVWEFKRKMDLGRVAARIYLLMGAETAYQALYQLLSNGFDLPTVGQLYLETSLPTLIYTTLVGTLVLLLSDLRMKLEVSRGRDGTKTL